MKYPSNYKVLKLHNFNFFKVETMEIYMEFFKEKYQLILII